MNDRKYLLLVSLLLVGSLLACGLVMAGETWAFWPTVAETNREQLAVGTVDCSVRVLCDGHDMPTDSPLEPGSYTVVITATGDAEGWFRMWLFAPAGDSESSCYRTQPLKPEQSASFTVELEEPAWLAVESRWDTLGMDSEELADGAVIRWGVPLEEISEEETETTEPETEATEPETETTEPETETTEPETETTEPETEATEPETETTEPETEATEPETEETELETEVTEPQTESTENE